MQPRILITEEKCVSVDYDVIIYDVIIIRNCAIISK